MKRRNLVFSLVGILLPLQINQCKADEWDLNKSNLSEKPSHLQKWCPDRRAPSLRNQSNSVRYSNIPLPGYEPCGELKTAVVCDASGKKLISTGPPPYGFKECSDTPRIQIKRIGPPLPVESATEDPVELAKNTPSNPGEQISSGLKTYQDYISSLDQLSDKEPSSKNKKSKLEAKNLDSLSGAISPEMLSEAMKLLSSMGQ